MNDVACLLGTDDADCLLILPFIVSIGARVHVICEHRRRDSPRRSATPTRTSPMCRGGASRTSTYPRLPTRRASTSSPGPAYAPSSCSTASTPCPGARRPVLLPHPARLRHRTPRSRGGRPRRRRRPGPNRAPRRVPRRPPALRARAVLPHRRARTGQDRAPPVLHAQHRRGARSHTTPPRRPRRPRGLVRAVPQRRRASPVRVSSTT